VNYLLMIAGDETAAEHANDGCEGWSEEMLSRGVVRGGGALRPPTEATTVRLRDGAVLLSDGPFAESREQLGGFVLIECADLDEAIEIASKHPAASYGTIEIRPMLDVPPHP
jgi:hypothetical protein